MNVRWLIPIGAGAAAVVQVAQATQYLSVAQAQRAAFPAATSFVAMSVPLDAATHAAIGAPPDWTPYVWQARSDGGKLGWFMLDRVIGKSELITYAVALDAHGAVSSVEVLDYRESHGGEIRLPAWRRQFVGKTAQDTVALNRDIRNISGATLSCRHVTDGVHRLLQVYARVLAHGRGQ